MNTIPWLTQNQHLRWGLLRPSDPSTYEPWAFRKGKDNLRFHFELGRCSRPLKSWRAEFADALQYIIDYHGSEVALFYSGGADSEAVLRGLLAIGVIPEVHTIKFTGNFNTHETKNAEALCESLGVRMRVWEHDVRKWLAEEKYLDLGVKYECDQVAYLTVLEYARKINRPVIMGGEIYVQQHQVPDGSAYTDSRDWYYVYRENEDGVTYRYTADTGHPIINEVMTYTPELLAAFLIHPRVQQVVTNKVPGKITLLSVKGSVYEDEFGHPLGAKVKYHGYERLQWSNLSMRNVIREQINCSQQQAKIPYQELVRHLLTGEPPRHENKSTYARRF